MRLIVVDKALRRRAAELQATARAAPLPAGRLRDSIPADPAEFRRRFNEQAALMGVEPLPQDWRWPAVVVVGRRRWWRRRPWRAA